MRFFQFQLKELQIVVFVCAGNCLSWVAGIKRTEHIQVINAMPDS